MYYYDKYQHFTLLKDTIFFIQLSLEMVNKKNTVLSISLLSFERYWHHNVGLSFEISSNSMHLLYQYSNTSFNISGELWEVIKSKCKLLHCGLFWFNFSLTVVINSYNSLNLFKENCPMQNLKEKHDLKHKWTSINHSNVNTI